jgi:chromosome partitioning protein
MANSRANRGYHFPDKARRISFIMCKGGVGKTTVTYFLAKRLASYGARVLLIDSDPQGNLTAALRPDRYGIVLTENTPVLVDVLSGKCAVQDAILKLTPQLHILPSTAINSLLERRLLELGGNAISKLDHVLRAVERNYDYILIDCAPSLNVVNASIIYASDQVILPVQLDEFSRLGLRQTVMEIRDLEKEFGFVTTVKILLNRFSAREKLSFLYLGHLADEYRSMLMSSTIRQSAEIKTALSLHRDFFSRADSKAREDFDALTHEILPPVTEDREQNAWN